MRFPKMVYVPVFSSKLCTSFIFRKSFTYVCTYILINSEVYLLWLENQQGKKYMQQKNTCFYFTEEGGGRTSWTSVPKKSFTQYTKRASIGPTAKRIGGPMMVRHMLGCRIFCQGVSRHDFQKIALTMFFFLSPQLILQFYNGYEYFKENYDFTRFQRGSNIF